MSVYSYGLNTPAVRTIDMVRSDGGTWVASLPEKLYGKFYTFSIRHNGKWLKETPGVWAKAVGTNGERAAVINMSDTDPEGWESDKGPALKHINDAVIYEMHHRDFSIDPRRGL